MVLSMVLYFYMKTIHFFVNYYGTYLHNTMDDELTINHLVRYSNALQLNCTDMI